MTEVERAVKEEKVRAVKAIFAEIARIRAASPFPIGSGEPVAVALEHMVEGCRRAAQAIM